MTRTALERFTSGIPDSRSVAGFDAITEVQTWLDKTKEEAPSNYTPEEKAEYIKDWIWINNNTNILKTSLSSTAPIINPTLSDDQSKISLQIMEFQNLGAGIAKKHAVLASIGLADASAYIYFDNVDEELKPKVDLAFNIMQFDKEYSLTEEGLEAIQTLIGTKKEGLENIYNIQQQYNQATSDKINKLLSDDEIKSFSFNTEDQRSQKEIEEYKKSIQSFSQSVFSRAERALTAKTFMFQSIDPIALMVAIEIAVRYGATDISGIYLVETTQVVFGRKEFKDYERLAHAISALHVTPAEIAERKLLAAENNNAFGHLDIFELKMLNSIDLKSTPQPKIEETLQNIRLHAIIIGNDTIANMLQNIEGVIGDDNLLRKMKTMLKTGAYNEEDLESTLDTDRYDEEENYKSEEEEYDDDFEEDDEADRNSTTTDKKEKKEEADIPPMDYNRAHDTQDDEKSDKKYTKEKAENHLIDAVKEYNTEHGTTISTDINDDKTAINALKELIFCAKSKFNRIAAVRYCLNIIRADTPGLINYQDQDGNTVLILASQNGKENMVKLLLEEEAIDPTIKNNNGDNATDVAKKRTAAIKIQNAVRKHISKDKEKPNTDDSKTLSLQTGRLSNSITANDQQKPRNPCIDYLKSVQKDSNETEIMHLAMNKDKYEDQVVDTTIGYFILESNNINETEKYIDSKNSNGKTALMLAAENGNLQVVKALIKHNANLDIKDPNGNTALILAVKSDKIIEPELRKDIALALKDAHANVNILNNDGKSANDLSKDQNILKPRVDSTSKYSEVTLKKHDDKPNDPTTSMSNGSKS